MKFDNFLTVTRDYSLIDTSNLPSPLENLSALRVQISRWVKSGKLLQLRRGIYVLAEPFRKRDCGPLCVASVLQRPSYVSMEKALEHYDLIPEAVHVTTSLTTKRPGKYKTPLGRYDYYHVGVTLFWGYQSVRANKETAFVALPEKALLDLFYFRHGDISRDYIEELRLQNLEIIDIDRLMSFAKRFGKPKILRAARRLADWVHQELREEKTL